MLINLFHNLGAILANIGIFVWNLIIKLFVWNKKARSKKTVRYFKLRSL